jgi:hypothetical protein
MDVPAIKLSSLMAVSVLQLDGRAGHQVIKL